MRDNRHRQVWQALSEVLGTLHRIASFTADFNPLCVAVGNGILRDALQEVGPLVAINESFSWFFDHLDNCRNIKVAFD